MTPEFWAIVAVGGGVLSSHLSLHRDIAGLRERMAKLEGAVEGFMRGHTGRTDAERTTGTMATR